MEVLRQELHLAVFDRKSRYPEQSFHSITHPTRVPYFTVNEILSDKVARLDEDLRRTAQDLKFAKDEVATVQRRSREMAARVTHMSSLENALESAQARNTALEYDGVKAAAEFNSELERKASQITAEKERVSSITLDLNAMERKARAAKAEAESMSEFKNRWDIMDKTFTASVESHGSDAQVPADDPPDYLVELTKTRLGETLTHLKSLEGQLLHRLETRLVEAGPDTGDRAAAIGQFRAQVRVLRPELKAIAAAQEVEEAEEEERRTVGGVPKLPRLLTTLFSVLGSGMPPSWATPVAHVASAVGVANPESITSESPRQLPLPLILILLEELESARAGRLELILRATAAEARGTKAEIVKLLDYLPEWCVDWMGDGELGVQMAWDLLGGISKHGDTHPLASLARGVLSGELDESVWWYATEVRRFVSAQRWAFTSLQEVLSVMRLVYPSRREDWVDLVDDFGSGLTISEAITLDKIHWWVIRRMIAKDEPRLLAWTNALMEVVRTNVSAEITAGAKDRWWMTEASKLVGSKLEALKQGEMIPMSAQKVTVPDEIPKSEEQAVTELFMAMNPHDDSTETDDRLGDLPIFQSSSLSSWKEEPSSSDENETAAKAETEEPEAEPVPAASIIGILDPVTALMSFEEWHDALMHHPGLLVNQEAGVPGGSNSGLPPLRYMKMLWGSASGGAGRVSVERAAAIAALLDLQMVVSAHNVSHNMAMVAHRRRSLLPSGSSAPTGKTPSPPPSTSPSAPAEPSPSLPTGDLDEDDELGQAIEISLDELSSEGEGDDPVSTQS